MKRTVLKAISILISVLLTVSVFTILIVAASSNRIYSDEIEVKPGETFDVPVLVSNNTGIMGFSIILTYDEDVCTPDTVTKGRLITSGLFDDSIGTTEEKSFKVVWSGTKGIKDDGELFVVTFKANETFNGNGKIEISYEKNNTFDENYKDIVLNCEDVIVKAETNSPQKLSIWQKIINFFVKIWNWIKNLFVR